MSLFNLLHWQGNGHYENLHWQCHGIAAEMHSAINDGGLAIMTPDDDEGDYFAQILYYLSADGAMIAAEEGASQFQGIFLCPWFLCPKD